ncbi:AMP nucleosidase [Comamonas serinivorans]|uniref:AMP nucleosidase n=1 Tax=Comamonas serinivorans TaxID=1082851 RepID=A0A1Y0EJM8_9BURK|nr:AMP nucleosidase [Comamonas serinivorans]ARU03835.1 AMP nucleosidase [Comamonas serinivorans]
MSLLPDFIAPASFHNAQDALAQAQRIYTEGVAHLRQALVQHVNTPELPTQPLQRVRAHYPLVRMLVRHAVHPESGPAFGFVAEAGHYETTLTRPDLFGRYNLEQFQMLLHNHGGTLEVGTSSQPIPLPFILGDDDVFETSMTAEQRRRMGERFDMPDLAAMDDGIANGTLRLAPGAAKPLSLFTAPRVDYSLHRLRHYTGTSPEHFQNFILFTNYQFYIDEFIALGEAEMAQPDSAYQAFVQPGNRVLPRVDLVDPTQEPDTATPVRLPQMPAYHLKRPDGSGITMVNIGVGPANAKTITDHIAVLRPHAWVMLGHCAGLRSSQQLGDYVLAHAYVREDHVLDEDLPLWIPLPALSEIQLALEHAVEQVTHTTGAALKRIMRTGTVASTDNRNWELLSDNQAERRFSQSRAVALDMESATIAANGFRFRVPYGTLLCVSDKPLHGEIKLPGMANHFYRERVNQHLQIGIRAMELLREGGTAHLHSRKLRSFAEVAFQ